MPFRRVGCICTNPAWFSRCVHARPPRLVPPSARRLCWSSSSRSWSKLTTLSRRARRKNSQPRVPGRRTGGKASKAGLGEGWLALSQPTKNKNKKTRPLLHTPLSHPNPHANSVQQASADHPGEKGLGHVWARPHAPSATCATKKPRCWTAASPSPPPSPVSPQKPGNHPRPIPPPQIRCESPTNTHTKCAFFSRRRHNRQETCTTICGSLILSRKRASAAHTGAGTRRVRASCSCSALYSATCISSSANCMRLNGGRSSGSCVHTSHACPHKDTRQPRCGPVPKWRLPRSCCGPLFSRLSSLVTRALSFLPSAGRGIGGCREQT